MERHVARSRRGRSTEDAEQQEEEREEGLQPTRYASEGSSRAAAASSPKPRARCSSEGDGRDGAPPRAQQHHTSASSGEDVDEGSEPPSTSSSPAPLPACAELPTVCWKLVMEACDTRSICMLARSEARLRALSLAERSVWEGVHARLFGRSAGVEVDTRTLRRLCRRSELAAARWVDAAPARPRSVCAVSGDAAAVELLGATQAVSVQGAEVRLWELSGRRLGTLKGHSAPVTCVAAAAEAEERAVLATGCRAETLRFWDLDELKCARVCRTPNGDPPLAVAVVRGGGPPVSATASGVLQCWSLEQTPPLATIDGAGASGSGTLAVTQTHLYSGLSAYTIEAFERENLFSWSDYTGDRISALAAEQSTLAAGADDGALALFDARSMERVATTAAGGPAAAKLNLEGWRLVAGVGRAVRVYDVRALGRQSLSAPVLSFDAELPVTDVAARGDTLLVSRAGGLCVAWQFGARAPKAEACGGEGGAAAAEEEGGRRKKDKSGPRAHDKSRKYPKRRTR